MLCLTVAAGGNAPPSTNEKQLENLCKIGFTRSSKSVGKSSDTENGPHSILDTASVVVLSLSVSNQTLLTVDDESMVSKKIITENGFNNVGNEERPLENAA